MERERCKREIQHGDREGSMIQYDTCSSKSHSILLSDLEGHWRCCERMQLVRLLELLEFEISSCSCVLLQPALLLLPSVWVRNLMTENPNSLLSTL